jgi:hypothetical protein
MLVPQAERAALTELHRPKAGDGRRPIGVQRRLPIHPMQASTWLMVRIGTGASTARNAARPSWRWCRPLGDGPAMSEETLLNSRSRHHFGETPNPRLLNTR